MKKTFPLLVILLSLVFRFALGQSAANKDIFPAGTTVLADIPYADDTLKKHTLDVYMPAVKTLGYPVIIWIHCGAWMLNDKHADMSYMTNTIKEFLNNGYVIVSIDYRHSTTASFPAQMQDCNRAIEFIYENAAQYSIDESRIALIGFSAGGHLASLIGLSNNNFEKSFYYNGKRPKFKISVVLDFYGASDFSTLKGHDSTDPRNPITLLLGGTVAQKPELAKKASPITYIDKNDPPFFIVQGEKDESVNPDQSILLSTLLKKNHVPNELVIVPGAPHFGVMFDTEFVRNDLLSFLNKYMK